MNSLQKRILVPVDISEQSLKTVMSLRDILNTNNNQIVLFHVLSKVPESFYDIHNGPEYKQILTRLRAWENNMNDVINKFMTNASIKLIYSGVSSDSINCKIQARRKGIARDIIEEVNKGYDGIVVGRYGSSKLRNIILGSVAHKLVQKIDNVPLCLVGVTPKSEKALIAFDESESANQAVEKMVNLMKISSAEITLIHVIRELSSFEKEVNGVLTEADKTVWFDLCKKAIEDDFRKAKDKLENAGIDSRKIKTTIINGASSRAGTLINYAEKNDIDTIVVGRKGISRVPDFYMGRVSRKVIHMAEEKNVWLV